MEKQQITRIPYKYLEILETLPEETVWKIFKNILWWSYEIDGIWKVYQNLMMVDIENINISAWKWKKWWRPKEEKPQVIEKITPGYEEEKPQVMKNDNQEENRIEEISKEEYKIDEWKKEKYLCDKTSSEFVELWNKQDDIWKLPHVRIETDQIKTSWWKIRKLYTWQNIIDWLDNYFWEIEKRDKNSDYWKHRFTAREFLDRKWWLQKFVNL